MNRRSQAPNGKVIWQYIVEIPKIVMEQIFYIVRDWVRGHTHD